MNKIPNLTKKEYNQLIATKKSSQWNAVCSQIKKDRGGNYPTDWYEKIIVSGILFKKQMEFEKND
jgi:hypothetical protein